MRDEARRRRTWFKAVVAALGIALLTAGCGSQYVVLDPAGPVAATELHLLEFVSIAMLVIIVPVVILFFYTVVKFRERPGRRAAYLPTWRHNRRLELWVWIIPLVVVIAIAIPTVADTFSLATLPKNSDPVVIDVTSLQYKWLFEYPGRDVATVNYLVIPSGRPVLFELTADSPMNTFWVPRLGGMEYTMPGRVLPLWLESWHPGVFWGHSGQFSGLWFEKMFFTVKAVTPSQFSAWIAATRVDKPMTLTAYHRLLKPTVVGRETFGRYPASTFPSRANGFTLEGGMYVLQHNQPDSQ